MIPLGDVSHIVLEPKISIYNNKSFKIQAIIEFHPFFFLLSFISIVLLCDFSLPTTPTGNFVVPIMKQEPLDENICDSNDVSTNVRFLQLFSIFALRFADYPTCHSNYEHTSMHSNSGD